ncbi:hypothetical protein BU17DRAFT_72154 [Hysterangium stoloniferum]|nr:hypothetical protein BU17DRAFT_72154 [Hysterangium stoloniferum]
MATILASCGPSPYATSITLASGKVIEAFEGGGVGSSSKKEPNLADGHTGKNPTEAKGRTESPDLDADGSGSGLVVRGVLGQAEGAALMALEKGGGKTKNASRSGAASVLGMREKREDGDSDDGWSSEGEEGDDEGPWNEEFERKWKVVDEDGGVSGTETGTPSWRWTKLPRMYYKTSPLYRSPPPKHALLSICTNGEEGSESRLKCPAPYDEDDVETESESATTEKFGIDSTDYFARACRWWTGRPQWSCLTCEWLVVFAIFGVNFSISNDGRFFKHLFGSVLDPVLHTVQIVYSLSFNHVRARSSPALSHFERGTAQYSGTRSGSGLLNSLGYLADKMVYSRYNHPYIEDEEVQH